MPTFFHKARKNLIVWLISNELFSKLKIQFFLNEYMVKKSILRAYLYMKSNDKHNHN